MKKLIGELELNRIYQRECIEGMRMLPDKSIDMILCDLPYGTTKNKWDTVIPFDQLWLEYNRIIKDNGAVVLTASQPFTTDLIVSNRKMFRYELVWDKTKSGNFALARKQPMKSHENILVFYKQQPTYNPQMEVRGKPRKKGGGKASENFGITPTVSYNNEYYPKSIVSFSTGSRKNHFHPTQKPEGLFEWLIKTYTNENEIVLDNCMGSGTTAVAAVRNNRNFIGFEREPEYVEIANKRLDNEISPE